MGIGLGGWLATLPETADHQWPEHTQPWDDQDPEARSMPAASGCINTLNPENGDQRCNDDADSEVSRTSS